MTDSCPRRQFLRTTAAAGLGLFASSGSSARAREDRQRLFTMDLNPGAIGAKVDQRQAIELAHRSGFESITPVPGYLAQLSPAELEGLLAELKEKKLVWGAAGMPVDFRGSEEDFKKGLAELPATAAVLKRAGITRMSTWIRPSHDSLTYQANFKQHADRLRQIAQILGESNVRFGIEYVGPKTSWTSGRHAFVHTLAEAQELIAATGCDNMGVVLDSWHWYTAGETVDDIKRLSNHDVVACDLNDAPAGIAVDEQIDSKRCLPCASGVIDLKAFLTALVAIGYDGPVRAEPFDASLRELTAEQAIERTAQAMKQAFALVG